jgi:hypothetical protein
VIKVTANTEYLREYGLAKIFDRSSCEKFIDDILDISINIACVHLFITVCVKKPRSTNIPFYTTYVESIRESAKRKLVKFLCTEIREYTDLDKIIGLEYRAVKYVFL